MIDRILTFSVQHRWVVLLVTGLMMVVGGLALARLPIDAVPDITNNQVQINTVAPSLSPVEVERQVTFPVENALAGIAGLRSTRSLSRNGFSQVTAVFDDDVDIYFARQQVLERLTAVRESLPRGAEPRMGAISTGLGEIYMWSVEFAPQGDPAHPAPRDGQPGWQSDGSYLTPEGEVLRDDHRRAAYLRTLQDWVVRPQLRTVRGVAGVDSIGGYAKQYHVQPSTARLVALGLTFQDIVAALERNNASIGAGYFERGGEAFAVRADGRVGSLQEIEAIPVASREGVPILIRDVATVTAGRELRTGSASMNGEEVVIGTALMLIGENSRTVAAAVGTRIAEVNRAMPPGVRIRTVLDRTVLVDATIGTVSKNLAEGALLVVAVLFLLLGNIRAALVTAAVIPITMLLTAAGMLRGHISANLMSLGALDFGLIVDGAVIITENALRRLAERQHEEGRVLRLQERLETVADAAKQMVKPSLYGQAIIILVYLPMLTFTGVEGKMFAPMALTVIIALVGAFVLSLTFVPAAIAIFVGGRVTEKENRAVLALKAGYRPALRAATAAPMPVILAAALLFGGSLALFARLGQEFIPTLDEKNLAVQALRVPSTSLTQSQAMQSVVERAISRFPEVAFVFSKTGTAEIATDPMPPNISDTFIMLRPQEAWPNPRMTKAELVAQIEAVLARIPGNAYEFTQPIQMRFNELIAGVRGDIAIKIFGDDFGPMLQVAEQMAAALRATPGATDVRVEQATGLPFLDIRINRAAAARWGLSIADVQEAIAIAVGGREAGLVFEGDRRFDIIVRLPDVERSDLDALRNLPVPLPSGTRGVQMLPLRELATFRVMEGPNQVSREKGKRRIVVQANVRGRDIGSVVADAHARIERDVRLPPGYWTEWGGQFENLVAARQRLAVVVPACFALILLLLFSALRSWRDAAVVFTGVPLALTGGILALWVRDMPFSISAAVGFIALSGVAVLNGLVMVSYIRQLSTEGRPWREAIVEGALTRLRPVVMTALVAALGFVPMALATGTGAEVQRPLATVVIGGLISATVLTLVVLPALLLRFGKSLDETPAPRTPEVRIEPRLETPKIAAPDLVAGG